MYVSRNRTLLRNLIFSYRSASGRDTAKGTFTTILRMARAEVRVRSRREISLKTVATTVTRSCYLRKILFLRSRRSPLSETNYQSRSWFVVLPNLRRLCLWIRARSRALASNDRWFSDDFALSTNNVPSSRRK